MKEIMLSKRALRRPSKMSLERRLKVAIALTGRKCSFKGKPLPEEWRKNISISLRGSKNPQYGRVYSQEEKNEMREGRTGENTPHLWKGGITPLHTLLRSCSQFRQWRLEVFKRDKFTCQWCGDDRGGNLNADHIKPFSILIEENNITDLDAGLKCPALWDIANGRTLCVPCHKKTDTFGMRKKNIQLDLV